MACITTNCSTQLYDQLADTIVSHCNVQFDSSGYVTSADCGPAGSECRTALQTYMDNCMCIPDYCGWKGAPDQRVEYSRSKLGKPPSFVHEVDRRTQNLVDYCFSRGIPSDRRCPQELKDVSPEANVAYQQLRDYDCRYCGIPGPGTYGVWQSRDVNKSNNLPTSGSWPAPNIENTFKAPLGEGCQWNDQCQQVDLPGRTCIPPYKRCTNPGRRCDDGTWCMENGYCEGSSPTCSHS